MRAVVVAGTLLVAGALAGCSSDCKRTCEVQRSCGVTTASVDDCTSACERRAERLSDSSQVGACAACYDRVFCDAEKGCPEDRGCEKLFPRDPSEAGDCDDACGL